MIIENTVLTEKQKNELLNEIRFIKNQIEESTMILDNQFKCIDAMARILAICEVNY